ncbi:MAG: outer membrane beta-barrel family protein [Bacteroidales bacterium]
MAQSGYYVKGQIALNETTYCTDYTISLITPKGKFVGFTLTDSKGMFEIQVDSAGKYILNISFRQDSIRSDSLNIDSDIYMGKILLNEPNYKLDEIVIKAKQYITKNFIQKIEFNISKSSFKDGYSGYELIQEIPRVSANENTMSYLGKKGSLMLQVNGKNIPLSGKTMMDYIKSIPSSSIEKIEIIKSSAFSDAETSGMYLNISLKKTSKKSIWQVSEQTTFANKLSQNLLGTVYLSRKKLTLLSSIQGSFHQKQYIHDNTLIEHNFQKWNNSIRNSKEYDINYNLNIDYAFGKSTISAMYNLYYLNSGINGRIESVTDPVLVQRSFSTMEDSSYFFLHSFKTNYQLDISNKSNFNTSIDYILKNYKINQTIINDNSSSEYSSQNTISKALVWQMNYFYGNEELFNFRGGVKANIVQTLSDYYDTFKYTENTIAVYADMQKSFVEKWNFSIGGRYEYYLIDDMLNKNNSKNTYNSGSFFPSAIMSFSPNEENYLELSYSKSISRPSFNSITPYKKYVSPTEYYVGNPLLKPMIYHNVDLSYSHNDLSVSTYYEHKKDGIDQIVKRVANTDTLFYTFDNVYSHSNIGFVLSYTLKPTWWYRSISEVNGNLSFISSKIDNQQRSEGITISTKNLFYLNRDRTFSFGINYSYFSPTQEGLYSYKSSASLDLSLRMLLLNKKLSIQIFGTDILKQSVSKYSLISKQISQYYYNYNEARKLYINISFTFGNSSYKRSSGQDSDTIISRF